MRLSELLACLTQPGFFSSTTFKIKPALCQHNQCTCYAPNYASIVCIGLTCTTTEYNLFTLACKYRVDVQANYKPCAKPTMSSIA